MAKPHRQKDPKLVKELLQNLLQNFDWKALAEHSQQLPDIDASESTASDEDRKQLEDAQAKIKKQLPPSGS